MSNVTRLLIGFDKDCQLEAKKYIKTFIDKKEHKLIDSVQHPNLLWITPKGESYVNDDLEIVFEQIKYVRESFFVVIEKAEKLNEHGSNKLLKTIEEPPSGYQFILTTKEPALLLPTVRSRCIEIYLEEKQKLNLTNSLEQLLLETQSNQFNAYKLTQLEKSITNEEIYQAVYNLIKKEPKLYPKLKYYMENNIMPGSTKIALKTIYASLLEL